jgi:hypothetical protein
MTIFIVFLIALASVFVGGFIVALFWWWCNAAVKEVDQPDFDNEIHWHKYRENQSKRGDL